MHKSVVTVVPSIFSCMLRKLFMDAVGKPIDVADPDDVNKAAKSSCPSPSSGASRLTKTQLSFLRLVEKPEVTFESLIDQVEKMSPEALVECAAVCAEMLHHANLTGAHATQRTWKACLRADTDGSALHEGSSLPTFQAAFDKHVRAGLQPEALRAALCAQKVDLVLTAHPTEAQRRTILLKQKRTLLARHAIELFLSSPNVV